MVAGGQLQVAQFEKDAALEEEQAVLGDFLAQLWEQSADQSVWQTVYAVGGTLPLVIALAGSEAVMEIAQLAVAEGAGWRPVVELKVDTPDESDEREYV